MPGGRGKARHSCPLCKPYKFAGNNTGRYTAKEENLRKEMKREADEARTRYQE